MVLRVGCLEKVGFNLATLDASAAAITQQHARKNEFPKMVWNSNNFQIGSRNHVDFILCGK